MPAVPLARSSSSFTGSIPMPKSFLQESRASASLARSSAFCKGGVEGSAELPYCAATCVAHDASTLPSFTVATMDFPSSALVSTVIVLVP